jgi:hypothetical protein
MGEKDFVSFRKLNKKLLQAVNKKLTATTTPHNTYSLYNKSITTYGLGNANGVQLSRYNSLKSSFIANIHLLLPLLF